VGTERLAIVKLCENGFHVTLPSLRRRRKMTEMTDVSKEKLITDFKVVVADAEELLKATASQAGDKAADLRAKIQNRLADAKVRIADAEAALVDKAKQAGRAADDYVHDNPWRSVGVAAGIGLVIGLLIGRR
jgi:ElaB/YqjD/DUF883 family membrane-anchored ribosome-binding protein